MPSSLKLRSGLALRRACTWPRCPKATAYSTKVSQTSAMIKVSQLVTFRVRVAVESSTNWYRLIMSSTNDRQAPLSKSKATRTDATDVAIVDLPACFSSLFSRFSVETWQGKGYCKHQVEHGKCEGNFKQQFLYRILSDSRHSFFPRDLLISTIDWHRYMVCLTVSSWATVYVSARITLKSTL